MIGLALFLAAAPLTVPWGTGESKAEDLVISLVTFGPGDDLTEWFGHAALVVEDKRLKDSRLYNYGEFAFDNVTIPKYALGHLMFSVGARIPERNIESYKKKRRAVRIAELALDADGRFLAFRSDNTSNLGAHVVHFGPLNKGMAIPTTVYDVPAASIHGRSVVTNTSPTTPYRSSGRPEVMFVIERLIDLAARRHGFNRLDLRRKNLVPSSAMPYRNPVGTVYDSGDYRATLDAALAKVARQREFNEQMAAQLLGVRYMNRAEFARFFAEQDAQFRSLIEKLGLKVSPAR